MSVLKIQERIELVEEMIAENPTALSVTIPTATLEILLDRCKNREEIKKSEMKWRTKANRYEEAYRSAKAQLKQKKVYDMEERGDERRNTPGHDHHNVGHAL